MQKLRIDICKKMRGWVGENLLPVPRFQEIARIDSHFVPEKCIQEQKDRPKFDPEFSSTSSEIPVINFFLLANGDENELSKLDFAGKEWGFFQIINHGVAEKVIHDMKAAVAGFFDLPLEEKKKYAMAANDLQGYGQVYVVSEQQKLDWSDMIFLMTLPHEMRNFKRWPVAIPGFKEAVENYSTELVKVSEELFGNLSLLMGMEKDGMKESYGEMLQVMQMNCYPTCSRPDLVLGVSPHSDGSAITLLLQDDEITGLHISHKGGWVPVKAIQNAIVVNLGDATEAWSNGVFKSIEHRAVTNEKKARILVATFVFPNHKTEIGLLESMVDKDHPQLYKIIKCVDYIRHTMDRKMEGKVHTDFLKLDTE